MSPVATAKRWIKTSAAIAAGSSPAASRRVCGKSFELGQRRAERAMHVGEGEHALPLARRFRRFAGGRQRIEANAARRTLERVRGLAPALAARQVGAPIRHLPAEELQDLD